MGTGEEGNITHPSPSNEMKDNSVVNHSLLSEPSLQRNQSESSDEGVSIDIEGKGIENVTPNDPLIVENFDSHLPETVTLLQTEYGDKVYLIGTAHFSTNSQDDVSKVIRNVRPHIVMVELCRSRASILQMDEATIEREAKTISIEKMSATMKEHGVFHGLMYILLLNMSAKLTRELGMAPGGEFRRALAEVRKIPGCLIHLGDRPIQVTLKRALSVLSWWNSMRLVWHLIFSKMSITKEEVEKCKNRDLLDQMLEEMAGEFPELRDVFVRERDIYLTHSLQLTCKRFKGHEFSQNEQMRVVGIVGIGHVPGITQLWGTVEEEDIAPIIKIPEPSKSGRVVKVTLKITAISLVIWGCYKLIPVPKAVSNILDNIKISVLPYITSK